ncbi:MAG TPA: hypothetical protein VMY40_13000 [Anaerolineae bacterium]|nr:hypothetical protein [Anaerolineae bacterium]
MAKTGNQGLAVPRRRRPNHPYRQARARRTQHEPVSGARPQPEPPGTYLRCGARQGGAPQRSAEGFDQAFTRAYAEGSQKSHGTVPRTGLPGNSRTGHRGRQTSHDDGRPATTNVPR